MLKVDLGTEVARSRGAAPVEWSASVGSWCVSDPATIVAILKSDIFDVVDYHEAYENLARRTAVDLSAIARVLHNIPLANEGDRHAKLRRDFAQLIGGRSGAAKAALEEFVPAAVAGVFQCGRTVELVRDLVRPIDDVLFSELLGVPVSVVERDGLSVSQVFDRFLSLNRRRALQKNLAELSKTLGAHSDRLTASLDYASALLVVGYDSVLGTIGSSLLSLFTGAGDVPLSALSYPDDLPRTGVPYTERVATTDCVINGFAFRAGERVRLLFDSCPVKDAANSALFFGRGRHLCLGRDISLWTWRLLVGELAKLSVRVRVGETRKRPHDYVFTVYDKIEVTIHG